MKCVLNEKGDNRKGFANDRKEEDVKWGRTGSMELFTLRLTRKDYAKFIQN